MAEPPRDPSLELGSIFLGPKAENAELLERLLLEALRDHVFWRRNVHPEDGFSILESDKRSPAFERSASLLSQELMALLGELKGGVPFFSPRYIGHMCADLTLASLVGYFATMLYNPNNVAAEASPVTTRMELEVAAQLAAMVGFDGERHWGHLTSGGTVANFEALWVARNVKYLPLAVFGAADELGVRELPAARPDGRETNLLDLDLWGLLNLAPGAALDVAARFVAGAESVEEASEAIASHTLARVGYQEYGRRLALEFGDALPPAVVLVPATAHYSWSKICRALGIGADHLVHVPVDRRFRMDTHALWETLEWLARRRQAVVAVVGVLGTTEESAFDRLDEVAALRERAGRELGLAFPIHVDAAWGGYALSVTRERSGARRAYEDVVADSLAGVPADDSAEPWPEEGIYHAFCAVEAADSVTIDPHKLGFVPYPAGAVLFADRRGRDLVASEAPYLFHRGVSEWGQLGQFIFEGSKPGAAAAGVWLSHRVLPLDAEGHGRLVHATVRGARALHRRLREGKWAPFRVVPLPDPDMNIVCFVALPPGAATVAEANAFATGIYDAMSAGAARQGGRGPDYYVTKTVLRAGEYRRSVEPMLATLGFAYDDYLRAGGLSVVRCTVMDPFLVGSRARTDFVEGFAATLARVMREVAAA